MRPNSFPIPAFDENDERKLIRKEKCKMKEKSNRKVN